VAESGPASVLDASALMAVLHAEEGASIAIDAIGEGAAVSVVNWARSYPSSLRLEKIQRSQLQNFGGLKGLVGLCQLSR
jgi:PIN domain nuclease of toxin-antitoxin system